MLLLTSLLMLSVSAHADSSIPAPEPSSSPSPIPTIQTEAQLNENAYFKNLDRIYKIQNAIQMNNSFEQDPDRDRILREKLDDTRAEMDKQNNQLEMDLAHEDEHQGDVKAVNHETVEKELNAN